MHRLRAGSDLIVLQGGLVLRDVIEVVRTQCSVRGQSAGWSRRSSFAFRYYEGVNANFEPFRTMLNSSKSGVLSVFFDWGDVRNAETVWNEKWHHDNGTVRNVFLHPVFEYNYRRLQLFEDIFQEWSASHFEKQVKYMLNSILHGMMAHGGSKSHTSELFGPRDAPKFLVNCFEKEEDDFSFFHDEEDEDMSEQEEVDGDDLPLDDSRDVMQHALLLAVKAETNLKNAYRFASYFRNLSFDGIRTRNKPTD
jgi:hypothetical protein